METEERARPRTKPLLANWDKIVFLTSLILLVYGIGFVTAHFGLPPYGVATELWSAAQDWEENWGSKLGIEPSQHLKGSRQQGSGVVHHDETRAQPGVTLLESLYDDQVALRLIDPEGNVLHTWPAEFSEIPLDPEIDFEAWQPRTDWEVLIHGSWLFPNGDVVFNFGGLTLVRMNACGEVLWTLPEGVHHSIHVADDGNIWTLGRRYHEEKDARFPGMRPRFRDELILEVSPGGEILRKLSILEILYENDLLGALFPLGLTHAEGDEDAMGDVLHANDVETLRQEDAAAFPLFEAGDLLVSLRNLNLVMVLNPETSVVKWSRTGPWLRQHDPDFLPDGRIMVFDNRPDAAGGRILGGSRLVGIDPVTGAFRNILQGSDDEPFYTAERGRADRLENGNVLITESQGGRVLEVTPAGEVVWEYINRYDAERVVAINGAGRYPESHGNFSDDVC